MLSQDSSNCLLIGEQSLLVQCGDLLLERGFLIQAVIAKNPVLVDWAKEADIACFASEALWLAEYRSNPRVLDYLFSITNLRILSSELLALPATMAINYHDGPLPRYAGLNTPVWALLAGEQEYGVSWHMMSAKADAGDIVKQLNFPIVPEETAFTLNAKCYQAGLDSFSELVQDIVEGKVSFSRQNSNDLNVFYKKDKPSAAGLIDWHNSSESIARLVRALDFGGYANPVCSPKVLTAKDLLLFARAEVINNQRAEPGEVLAVEEDALTVATGDGAVRFEGLMCPRGFPVSIAEYGVVAGATLPLVNADVKKQIDDYYAKIAGKEDSLVDRFKRYQSIPLPSLGGRNAPASKVLEYGYVGAAADIQNVIGRCNESLSRSPMQATANPSSTIVRVMAAVALMASRFSRESDLSFLYLKDKQGAKSLQENFCFSSLIPINISLSAANTGFQSLEAQLASQIPITDGAADGYASDLFARHPELKGRQFDSALLFHASESLEITGADRELYNKAGAQIVLRIDQSESCSMSCVLREDHDPEVVRTLLNSLSTLLWQLIDEPNESLGHYKLVDDAQWQQLQAFGFGETFSLEETDRPLFLHQQFEQQVQKSPEQIALFFEGREWTYRQLNQQANRIASLLIKKDVKPLSRIGVMLERSDLMLASMLGIWKAGCAYVPLDPVYPAQRLVYMAEDAGLAVLLHEDSQSLTSLPPSVLQLSRSEINRPKDGLEQPLADLTLPEDALAYVIYTSGSTGKPKGVMVEHRNVANFFAGMDKRLQSGPGTWLAVTSISFDISVLELFWTLSRGFKVVLYADEHRQKTEVVQPKDPSRSIDFNLFYWNVAEDESEYDERKYELLLEGAKFADSNGFNAVWTPERHFAAFGGLFPNPSVTSAALATITQNIELRAGSCVAPLHSPIRIAEEWAVVDNLSNGRVGIAAASGWAPPDFAIRPEAFDNAKQVMFDNVEIVRQLWRGETVNMPGPQGDVAVRTLPRPIQKELPIWITTAGNADSFKKAGEIGANLLTHLLGQSLEEVAEKVSQYRRAWKEAGHAGSGTVTLMLHTFVGPDLEMVEATVRGPMKRYLKSAMFLVKSAAWQFPTFKKMSEEQGKSLDDFFETISDQDMDDLLEFAFQRYFHSSGLFGTVDSCMSMVNKVKDADIDEIGCLIDYGIETPVVLEHLPYLAELLRRSKHVADESFNEDAGSIDYSLERLMQDENVTHLQCTPSMATMLLGDNNTRQGLSQLKQVMVGGEAFPPDLAAELKQVVSGQVTNMYGPTETTIWSSTANVKSDDHTELSALVHSDYVSIGTPLCNQSMFVVDEYMQPVPEGIAGELVIGGCGVTQGYHNREDLTADRFVADSFTPANSRFEDRQTLYRTGDLARWLPDGRLQCLGRVDHQVKIRGYRIELGEIESLCRTQACVSEAAVLLREDNPGDQRLVAYIVPASAFDAQAEQEIRATLVEQLPSFMVPTLFEILQALPLTPNGKIDRNALPAPKSRGQGHSGIDSSALPASQSEQMIAGIWKRALGIEVIGKRENFFDIGGHSLLVIQVLKELRDKVSRPVQMTDLFRYTTIEALASFLSGEQEDGAAVEQAQSRAAQRKSSVGRRRRRR